MASARDILCDSRLLLPPDLVQQCDQFFNALFEGHTRLAFAEHPMVVDGMQRAGFWDNAEKSAYEKVPALLTQIDLGARAVHGEPPIMPNVQARGQRP